MMSAKTVEEEFFLGDTEHILRTESVEDFFLGDLAEPSKNIDTSDTSASTKISVSELYELLSLDKKTASIGYKEYFKSKPDIFLVAGKNYYEPLSKEEFEQFENECNRWTDEANKKWRSVDTNYKIAELDDALGTLKAIFRTKESCLAYSKEIKANLTNQFNALLNQKTKDTILEISEILELIDFALSIHLIQDTEEERNCIIQEIRTRKKQNNFKIESFEETFLRMVKAKNKLARLDAAPKKHELFADYEKLARLNNQISEEKISLEENFLYEKMCSLLSKNNVLIPPVDFFITDFLEPEIERQKDHYNFSYPLNSEYFYYLKGTAIHIYCLTNEQWRELSLIRSIKNENETTTAFILGRKKAASMETIASLIAENPSLAKERIFSGDLETYFEHIARKNISLAIANIKADFSAKPDEMLQHIYELLKNQFTQNNIQEDPAKENAHIQSIENLIEAKSPKQEIVHFIVTHKAEETLISRITSEGALKRSLEDFFLGTARGFSYMQFVINILYELLLEPDITHFSFAFEKVARFVQQSLVSQSDFFTFCFVYEPIMEKAKSLSLNFSNEFSEDFCVSRDAMNKKKTAFFESEQKVKKKKYNKPVRKLQFQNRLL